MHQLSRSPTGALRLALALALLAAALACGKKQSAADAASSAVDVAPPEPAGPSDDERKTEAPEREPGNDRDPLAPSTPEPPLPAEANAGGAGVWITAPNLNRTIDRVVALVDGLRATGGDLLGTLPPADVLRVQAEQMVRGALLGQALGLGDPSLVDLGQPVRLRLSFPASGPPAMVVSLGTSRPIEPIRTGKLAGIPTPDGRYLVGLGVEPDPQVAWPPEEPGAAELDISAAVNVGTALPALLGALQELQAMTARLRGVEPSPAWLAALVEGVAGYITDVVKMDRLILGARLPAGPAEPPLRISMGFRAVPDSPVAAALGLLGANPPPFGLLESVDAGGDMWVAGRVDPAGVQALFAAVEEPTQRLLAQALDEKWRAPVVELYAALVEAFVPVDGRIVGASRTLPDGKGVFTFVWGLAGDAEACRAALRRAGNAAATLLARLSEEFSLGATIQWTDKAARSGNVDVDRLSIVVPRAALGPMAEAIQPGTGDLRWDVSVAVGPKIVVMTSDPAAPALQRVLSGQGQGGGIAGGSPLADRLAAPEPSLLELGSIDLAAGFRNNPALSCPAGTSFPALPMSLEMRQATNGFDIDFDFLPGSAGAVFPFLKAMTTCVPGSTADAAPPATARP